VLNAADRIRTVVGETGWKNVEIEMFGKNPQNDAFR
jgi:hypothetical protein